MAAEELSALLVLLWRAMRDRRVPPCVGERKRFLGRATMRRKSFKRRDSPINSMGLLTSLDYLFWKKNNISGEGISMESGVDH